MLDRDGRHDAAGALREWALRLDTRDPHEDGEHTAHLRELADALEAEPEGYDPIAAAQAAADALGERLAGIAWPCASDGDNSLPFVERDDEVNAYVDDDQAAQTLAHLLGRGARVMWAERHDQDGALQPFVYAPGAPGAAQARHLAERDEAGEALRELFALMDEDERFSASEDLGERTDRRSRAEGRIRAVLEGVERTHALVPVEALGRLHEVLEHTRRDADYVFEDVGNWSYACEASARGEHVEWPA